MAGWKYVGAAALVAGGTLGQASAQGWVAELEAHDQGSLDHFGEALALSGTSLVVGARHHDIAAAIPNSGAAYVFVETAAGFIEEAQILPHDPVIHGKFGHSVAIDGDTILVGAPDARVLGFPEGAVYFFHRAQSVWVGAARIEATTPAIGDRFGWSVAIEGEWAAVGAYGDDAAGFNAGAVHIYRRQAPLSWVLFAELRPEQPGGNDFFGQAVALDGERLLVGAPGEDSVALDGGAAYLFAFDGTSWVEQKKVTVASASAQARFGEVLDLDGSRMVVSALHSGILGSQQGEVYIFDELGGEWELSAQLAPKEAGAGDGFGWRVDLLGDDLLVGGPRFDGVLDNGGSAWLFSKVSAEWLQIRALHAPSLDPNEGSGSAVALGPNRIFVAGYQDSNSVLGAGSVQVWSRAVLQEHHAFCFGVTCPCANDDAEGGCSNTSGRGARLSASGSLQIANRDLALNLDRLVPGQPTVVLSGSLGAPWMFGDGLSCLNLANAAFLAVPGCADAQGLLYVGPNLFDPAAEPAPGSTLYFQAWYRDPVGAPCGSGFNLSNALGLQFVP